MLMNMGKRFKELRKERKFTQQQLADRIGLAPSAISSYESGARYPSYDVLIKYSKIFHDAAKMNRVLDRMNLDFVKAESGSMVTEAVEKETAPEKAENQMEKETVIQVINTFIDAKK